MQRRLAAILAADMVGYSRLMGADEEGTIARQKAHLSDLVVPIIAAHHGRIVKTLGDGVLVEFGSVVDAVRCAVDLQNKIAEREADFPEDRRIQYRIGINLGDIVIDGDDILGDGVNVAARLEGLAEPGGICISESAYEQVRQRLDLDFQDLGKRTVKNIAAPLRVYSVLPKNNGRVEIESRRSLGKRLSIVGAISAVFALVATGLYLGLGSDDPVTSDGPQDLDPDATRASQTVERSADSPPPIPSIAVLPFQNLSGNPEQDYFADGMAEDIITDLSKLPALFVIARNSSFRYKGQSIDVKQVGRELGARYLLEGSVRRAGDQLRINAQLIDAETGGHLWAERYDGTLADTFALQDKVTGRIIESLALKLGTEEQSRLADHGTTSFEAYDAFLKAQSYARQFTSEGFTMATKHYLQALAADPDYARASEALVDLRYIEEFSGLK